MIQYYRKTKTIMLMSKEMGQYLKQQKIGTCESMYYLTLSEAQALAKQEAQDDDGITFDDDTFKTSWRILERSNLYVL